MAGRGGARPGAGRPSAAAQEEKRTAAQRTQAKCQGKIQAKLPELIDEAIVQALAGDKALLKFLIENGLGKAAVKQTALEDTQIKVVLGNIPRPGKAVRGKDDEDELVGGVEDAEGAIGALPDEDGVDDGDAAAEEEAEAIG